MSKEKNTTKDEVKAVQKAQGFVSVDPTTLKLPPQNQRGRANPHTPEHTRTTALSIFTYGQKEAIGVYKDHEGNLVPNYGFGRLAAILLLREGFEHEGTKYHIPDLRINAQVQTVNEEQAFLGTLIENLDRTDTNPLDDAMNQEQLRTRFNKSNAQIAEIYHYSNPQKVYQLQRILALSEEHRQFVANGELSFAAAVDLATIPPEDRNDALSSCGDKITSAGLVAYMRAKNIEMEQLEEALRNDAEAARTLAMPTIAAPGTPADDALATAMGTAPANTANPAPTTVTPAGNKRKKGRGASQSKLRISSGHAVKVLEAYADAEETSDTGKAFAKVLTKWLNGGMGDDTFTKKIAAQFPLEK